MAEAAKENAAPLRSTGKPRTRAARAARGVLRWGETMESLFILDEAKPERKTLADRVVARPDDPGAWWALLKDVPEESKRDARCRLFRRATQSIPKNRPELYESEVRVRRPVFFLSPAGAGTRFYLL